MSDWDPARGAQTRGAQGRSGQGGAVGQGGAGRAAGDRGPADPAGSAGSGADPGAAGPEAVDPEAVDPEAMDPQAMDPQAMDPERLAELEQARLRGATRAVRGMFAGTLCLEAFTVILVPRTVAQFGSGLTAVKLTVLLVLAGLLVVTAFVQRRRWGVRLGTALQLGVIACGVLTSAMYVLGGIFALIWWYELRVRRELLTPRVPPTPWFPAVYARPDFRIRHSIHHKESPP